jgi:hypothetical protein
VALTAEARGDHLGVVEDQPVAGQQILGQVDGARVDLAGGARHQQPRRAARLGGPRRDQRLGEVKVEIR